MISNFVRKKNLSASRSFRALAISDPILRKTKSYKWFWIKRVLHRREANDYICRTIGATMATAAALKYTRTNQMPDVEQIDRTSCSFTRLSRAKQIVEYKCDGAPSRMGNKPFTIYWSLAKAHTVYVYWKSARFQIDWKYTCRRIRAHPKYGSVKNVREQRSWFFHWQRFYHTLNSFMYFKPKICLRSDLYFLLILFFFLSAQHFRFERHTFETKTYHHRFSFRCSLSALVFNRFS